MRKPLVDRIPFAKIIIGLVIAFFVSLGLCGLTIVLSSGAYDGFATFGIVEFLGMALSAAGLILTLVVWVTLSAVSSFDQKVSQPQRLFEKDDDTKLDKRE